MTGRMLFQPIMTGSAGYRKLNDTKKIEVTKITILFIVIIIALNCGLPREIRNLCRENSLLPSG